ncbi:transcriptional regulator, LysR family [Nitrosospira multiformis]|uniref:Transcriptional regulator, LysR family n=1 Tax=Nitrosospira multiformis TaxID=1231 RepID=A0A1I0EZX0_9PROT|nr:transcriptional activator NhaR [Nitrosospira multiformis]SET51255.1 transcriptional regulator, LysR family [Nitrosospira multiformis]
MLNYKQLHYFWAVAKAGSIVRASERLNLTPQTLSGQIGLLEDALGAPLFLRVGRRLELTETGRLTLSYADEIFQIGNELEEALRARPERHAIPFRVGVDDAVPKSIAYRLLTPAMELASPVRIVCREDKLVRLLVELAIQRIDLVLADRPMPDEANVKGYSHKLGNCGITFFAAPPLANTLRQKWPHLLDAAPLLIPGKDAAIRTPLMRWFDIHQLRPHIVGEFDDSALMQAFGQAGIGIFIAPSVIADEVQREHGVVVVGRTDEVTEQFYAISLERRLTHPAVVAINDTAHRELFATLAAS